MSDIIRDAINLAGLKLVDYDLKFVKPLTRSTMEIDHIIIHHDIWKGGTMKHIHEDHIHHRGWSGVGYHARVRTDGSIELGRPFGTVGAHCKEESINHKSVGIVFEGNFDNEQIGEEQFEAGAKLIRALVDLTGIKYVNIKGHRDYAPYKSCPGNIFPLSSLIRRADSILIENADVSSWAQEAWLWIKKNKISDGSRPKDSVTREEIWVMLHRMAIK